MPTSPTTFLPLGKLMIGTATSSLQIEGGDRNNNWYEWAQHPGTIADGTSPLRANDHWNRWREDTELMGSLGLKTYRMGIEWSRIEPAPGQWDVKALDRYREEIALVKERGMVPLVTLHHFNNPLWFQRLGEWEKPENIAHWLRFVDHVVTGLSDLVTDWVTINEPNVYATSGFLFHEAPPAKKSYRLALKVMRNMAIAHCRAYRLIHGIQPGARVGFAHHMRAFVPAQERNPLHRLASRSSAFLFQDELSHAMLGGKFRGVLGRQPSDISPGKYYDYLGLNYYSRTASAGFEDGTLPGKPVNDLGWEIYPEGLIECAGWMHERYPAPIWVTENGTCDNGSPTSLENFRCRFIYDHLAAISASDLPFERYYHWCFVDNWEWADGEAQRFGLVHNDYATQTRTPKLSAEFLSRIITEDGISGEAKREFVDVQRYRIG